jgi:hypothetical protein
LFKDETSQWVPYVYHAISTIVEDTYLGYMIETTWHVHVGVDIDLYYNKMTTTYL